MLNDKNEMWDNAGLGTAFIETKGANMLPRSVECAAKVVGTYVSRTVLS